MPKDESNICAIYDAGPDIWDRYTVFLKDIPDMALCMSALLNYSEFATSTRGEHLGERIRFGTCLNIFKITSCSA